MTYNPHHCLICQEQKLEHVPGFNQLPRVTSDAKPFESGGTLCACMGCGTIQKIPDPQFLAEISGIYSAYELYKTAHGNEQVVFTSKGPQKRSQVLTDFLESEINIGHVKKILDVGCGNGAALRTYSRRFPNAALWGAELSDRNLASLETIPAFRQLFTSELAEIKEKFDLLSIIHVLEHVINPVQFISDCVALLAPSGHLLIDVPDVKSSPFDLIIADHLTHFSENTLELAITKTGYLRRHLSNRVLSKELTALVTPTRAEHNETACDDGYQHATRMVTWLRCVLDEAHQISASQNVGIFGTAMAGMWLYGAIRGRVDFFVDEDPSKVGGTIDGIPVVHPSTTTTVPVVIPLPAPLAVSISERWSGEGRHFVPLGARSEAGLYKEKPN